ncbi:MAG TPA: EAL domain-containing protein [Noviherbaspirillum sp.]|nr:EAL domain-containing protein [Noviherbaspirillum sp.]
MFRTGKPAISNLFIGSVLKRPLISVDVPVIINGKVSYVLGIAMVPENFNTILHAQNLPSNWIAAVFDTSGTLAARTRSPEKFVGKKANANLLRAMMENAEGSIESVTLDGIPVESFFSRAPTTNWRVAIGISRNSLSAALARDLSMLAAGVIALFAIGAALAWLMGGRIAHSIRALTAPARALGEGNAAPIPQVEIKEAAEVASAIGRAADLLKTKDAQLTEAHLLAGFGTWSWDLKTNEVVSSESMPRICGRDIPAFPEQRGTLLTVESWKRINAAMQEALKTGKGYDLEIQVNHGSGAIRWMNAKCETVRSEQGEVIALRGMLQDIDARKQANERLRQSEKELRKFKFFSDHANDGHLLLDAAGRIRYVNHLACERLGYGEAELLQLQISDVDALHTEERFKEIFARSRKNRIPPFESMHRRKDGSTFPVEVTATVLELQGEWLMFSTSRDITERKQVEQRVRDASLHDSLTGLPNRALVMDYCERLLAGAQRGHGRGALLFIDLDRFKPINDTYGHETGDRVLQEVGKRLRNCTRHEDLVGRLGGDEFVIVLPHIAGDHRRARTVAQHVVDSICRPFRINGLELSISPSIGISYFTEHASDVSTLIHTADLAMYQAKQSGRANYQIYTPELEQHADQVHLLEARLRKALKNGALTLHYQPVIDIKSGKPSGAEALVRLDDNDGDAIGPDRFIPIAESIGLIGQLGEWVATEACRQQEEWMSQGMKITMAINVSPLQFRQPAFAEKLGRIISDSGADPSCLEIEVTESAIMENVDDAVEILNRIKSLGVKVALDDFGVGYSSLSSLTNLPLDKLKVDQSFVRHIELDQASRAVTEAILALGHSLKLDVHGEGIETENALHYLEAHGCNQAQGYWFSRPLPPTEFARWYHEQWKVEAGTSGWDRLKRIWSPRE